MLPCTPTDLKPSTKLKPIKLEIKEGETRNKKYYKLPAYEQSPACGLKVSFKLANNPSWIRYNGKNSRLIIKRKSAINGTYKIKVKASIEAGGKTVSTKDDLEIEISRIESNSTDNDTAKEDEKDEEDEDVEDEAETEDAAAGEA